jgi:hypothetical protein
MVVHDAKRRLRLVMELLEQEWCRQQTHGAGKPHSNEELHHENCRPLCPSLNDKPTICNACAGHVCLLSITIPYSQWPADKVAIGAGAPLAYNGKRVDYSQYICIAHLKLYWGTSFPKRVPFWQVIREATHLQTMLY